MTIIQYYRNIRRHWKSIRFHLKAIWFCYVQDNQMLSIANAVCISNTFRAHTSKEAVSAQLEHGKFDFEHELNKWSSYYRVEESGLEMLPKIGDSERYLYQAYLRRI